MRDDAVLRHALPLGRGLGRSVADSELQVRISVGAGFSNMSSQDTDDLYKKMLREALNGIKFGG